MRHGLTSAATDNRGKHHGHHYLADRRRDCRL